MDIDRIRYFHVFANVGSLVKASEILHISQPALSKAFRLLESEVGVKLLEPNGRGLRLTEAGHSLKKETASLLDQWLSLPEKLKGAQQSIPTRIGSFEVFSTYFLGHLMKFADLENVEVHEYGPGRLEQALAEDIVDIGITYVPIPRPGVEFIEVAKIKMGVFALAKRFGDVSFDELPFVVPLSPAEGTPSKVVGLDGWPDHKFKRHVKFRVTMMESALELCRQGYCAAYLPEFVVDLQNACLKPEHRLSEIESPLPKRLNMQSVYLIRRENMSESKLERQIARCLRSLK